MARPLWKGVITFGLVSLPMALYSATDDHTVHFHQIERGTGDRVRLRRVNERTGEEVAFEDIVKGYELSEGQYVVVEPEELEEIAPGRSRTIEITGFVDLDAIPPIYFAKTYYVAPADKATAKIYQLLTQALDRTRKAGLAVFSMRGKEYLTALSSVAGMLQLHTMHWSDEVRDPHAEIPELPDSKAAFKGQEVATAEQLIDMLTTDWKPEEYQDTFEQQVRDLVEAKAKGEEIAVSQGAPPETTNVIDLMDALRASLDAASSTGKEQAAGAARDGRSAPKSTRTPKAAGGKKTGEDLSTLTKAQLYERASRYEIAHRSTMNRDELQKAVEKAARGRHLKSAS
ncbi:Ku protein [Kitasatospora sp. NPDC056327]|uniref:non-homologous end joining protein Ku n=1 Tax=Kitasatospora sp. NPDC056327 TaxID=3345785 RepID=UPI0035E0189C